MIKKNPSFFPSDFERMFSLHPYYMRNALFLSHSELKNWTIDPSTVFDAILSGQQTRLNLQ